MCKDVLSDRVTMKADKLADLDIRSFAQEITDKTVLAWISVLYGVTKRALRNEFLFLTFGISFLFIEQKQFSQNNQERKMQPSLILQVEEEHDINKNAINSLSMRKRPVFLWTCWTIKLCSNGVSIALIILDSKRLPCHSDIFGYWMSVVACIIQISGFLAIDSVLLVFEFQRSWGPNFIQYVNFASHVVWLPWVLSFGAIVLMAIDFKKCVDMYRVGYIMSYCVAVMIEVCCGVWPCIKQ